MLFFFTLSFAVTGLLLAYLRPPNAVEPYEIQKVHISNRNNISECKTRPAKCALFSRLHHAVGIHVKPPSTVSMFGVHISSNMIPPIFPSAFIRSTCFFFIRFFAFFSGSIWDRHLYHNQGWEINCKNWTWRNGNEAKEKPLLLSNVMQTGRYGWCLCVCANVSFQVCFINEMSKNINNNLIAVTFSTELHLVRACIPFYARWNWTVQYALYESHSMCIFPQLTNTDWDTASEQKKNRHHSVLQKRLFIH